MNGAISSRAGRYAQTAVLLIATGLLPGATHADDAHGDDAQAVRDLMESTIDKVISILDDPELKGDPHREERRAKLRSTLLATTDVHRVSLLALGRQRTKLSEAQIDEFSEVFSNLVFVTYIANLEKYTDEKIRILSVEILPKSKAYAATVFITSDKEIPADFSFFKDEHGKWKVYDIKVEGVSMISNYRSQFSELLLKHTPDELISHLKKKVKENEEAN